MSREMKLRSKRVYLRRPVPEDFETLTSLYRSSRDHFKGYASSSYTRERFDEMLLSARQGSNAAFLVCRSDDDDIVGTLNLSQIFRKAFQNAYLGYQLFAGHTGHGYMTEAVDLSLQYAFLDLKLHRIEANVQPGNKRSIAVLERNGFTKEGYSRRYLKINGRWRDHERWAILREDWAAGRKNGRNRSQN